MPEGQSKSLDARILLHIYHELKKNHCLYINTQYRHYSILDPTNIQCKRKTFQYSKFFQQFSKSQYIPFTTHPDRAGKNFPG